MLIAATRRDFSDESMVPALGLVALQMATCGWHPAKSQTAPNAHQMIERACLTLGTRRSLLRSHRILDGFGYETGFRSALEIFA
jgi:hypothetical protein